MFIYQHTLTISIDSEIAVRSPQETLRLTKRGLLDDTHIKNMYIVY